MLYIIGTGLNDAKDISLKTLEILKNCDEIYQECYTCIQNVDFHEIETIIGKKIIMADRKLVEETMEIVEMAKDKNIAFLVAGSPFFATTHTDLLLRAQELGVETKTIHNVSIASVKGCYGLYSYNFDRTISICYFTDTWKPLSFYDNIQNNYKNGMHTLCLLDIKTDENRFMTGTEAIEQMLYAENELKYGMLNRQSKLFVVCRFATDSEAIYYDTVENLLKKDFGAPLHSIIFPAKLSPVEEEFVEKMFPRNK